MRLLLMARLRIDGPFAKCNLPLQKRDRKSFHMPGFSRQLRFATGFSRWF
jgi:hypothetical protein